MKKTKRVNIGLVGLGTVGTGLVRILKSHGAEIEQKTGIRLVLKKICVRSLAKKREVKIPRSILTNHPSDVIGDPSIQIVVELIGGVHPAREIIARSFAAGKHVVTANKALLAEDGRFIFRQAARYSRQLGFEASVCGGIPIVKSLKDGLVSNEVTGFLGIVNGTCNFILSLMSETEMDFRSALRGAQARGYAEKNPRLDVEGVDSAHKLAILARLAFRKEARLKDIFVEGIQALQTTDIEYAHDLGYTVKLLAIGKKLKNGLELRIHPTLLPADHPLSNVHGVYNAVFVQADQAGDLLFYGKGAGMYPTASAVLSDILEIAAGVSLGLKSLDDMKPARVLFMKEVVSKYYLRFQVQDEPGVLGNIAHALGQNRISILSVHQKESRGPRSVPVIILTHEAREEDVQRALKKIDSKRFIRAKTTLLRVEK